MDAGPLVPHAKPKQVKATFIQLDRFATSADTARAKTTPSFRNDRANQRVPRKHDL